MSAKILTSLLFLFAFTCSLVHAAEDRGSYTVNGIGNRKKAILTNGGDVWDLSIAMLETEFLTTNYTYGDAKTNDAANFGIFKQNWFMLRTSTEEFKSYTSDDYNKGAVLNTDLKQDIKTRQESQKHYSTDKWFAGHRNGESGLSNPNTQDITNYKDAVTWIHEQLSSDEKYLSDDTRFWVSVVAI